MADNSFLDNDLTESDDERGRRVNKFFLIPEVNKRWVDYNIKENRNARLNKGKLIEPNKKRREPNLSESSSSSSSPSRSKSPEKGAKGKKPTDDGGAKEPPRPRSQSNDRLLSKSRSRSRSRSRSNKPRSKTPTKGDQSKSPHRRSRSKTRSRSRTPNKGSPMRSKSTLSKSRRSSRSSPKPPSVGTKSPYDRLQERVVRVRSKTPSSSRSPSRSKTRRSASSTDSESDGDSRLKKKWLKSSQRHSSKKSSETQGSRAKRPRSPPADDSADDSDQALREKRPRKHSKRDNKTENKSLDQIWMGGGGSQKKATSFTIPKTAQLTVHGQTETKSIIKETNRILYDKKISLPPIELCKLKFELDHARTRFCSFFQFGRCPVTNVLSHDSKGSGKHVYAHACVTCYRVASIMIPHNLHQCPFTKVV